MRTRAGVFGLLLAVVALPAAAQSPVSEPLPPIQPFVASVVPDRGTFAVGGSLSLAVPGEELFETGWSLTGAGEYYLNPQLSIRAMISGTWWKIAGFEEDGTASPVAAIGNLVYRWNRGRMAPYMVGGVGMYKFRFTEADLDSSETQLGLNLGGGAEFTLMPKHAVTGEVLVHSVAGSAESLLNDYTPWYWTFSVGYKKYF